MTRLRAFIYALGALIVGVLAYLLGVGSFLGQRAEASVLGASAFTTSPPAPLSLVSPVSIAISLLIVGGIALWAHGFVRALVLFVVSAAAILASQLLKESWLERPQLFELDAWNTFPSGHMTVFAVLAGALTWAVPRKLRGVIVIMSAMLLGVVSWQLLEFGWHRPSDVLGGQALAVLAFALASWLGPRGSRRAAADSTGTRTRPLRVLMLVLTIIGALIVLVGLVLVALAAITRSDALMLNGGEISLIGVSVFTARSFGRLAPS